MAIKNELVISFFMLILFVSCMTNENEDNYVDLFIEKSNESYRKDSIEKIVNKKHEDTLAIFVFNLEIQEDSCWRHADSINSIKYYEDYLTRFPEGKYITTANQAILTLSMSISKAETESDIDTIFKISNIFEGYKGTFLKCADNRDGNVYNVIKMGETLWFAENLRFKPSEGRFWAFNNDPENISIHGYLYTWKTALTVCPSGWVLPDDKDWQEFQRNLNKQEGVATILKSVNNWKDSAFPTNNSSGFSAIPAGVRTESGDYVSQNTVAFWWTSTTVNNNQAFYRSITSSNNEIYRYYDSKQSGFSVRCVKYIE